MADVQTSVNISIHALRKESDRGWTSTRSLRRKISIHALRKESDAESAEDVAERGFISIHALRKESDRQVGDRQGQCLDFNPRSP